MDRLQSDLFPKSRMTHILVLETPLNGQSKKYHSVESSKRRAVDVPKGSLGSIVTFHTDYRNG
jgi:hypothetical protein